MPKKSPQSPTGSSFFPPNDQATYRDLLLFEERLKTNALALNRRKSRYQCMFCLSLARPIDISPRVVFLVQLIFAIIFLLCEVLLDTSFLSVSYQYLLRRALPNVYRPDVEVRLHPYVASGLLFVFVTTSLLFFATGLYSEKIGYANRYGHDFIPSHIPYLFYTATFPMQTAPYVTLICISICAKLLASRPTTHSPTSSLFPPHHPVDQLPKVGRGLLLPRSWGDGHHPLSRCRRYHRQQIPAGSSFSRPVWTASSGKRTSDIALRSSASGMSGSGRPLRALGVDGCGKNCHGTVLRCRHQTRPRRRPPRAAPGRLPCVGASVLGRRMRHSHLRGGRHLVSLQNQSVGDLR
jgi:hypothetical protein